MTNIRSIGDILGKDDESEQIYHSDQIKRENRAKMGYFTKNAHTFDFIHLVKNWEKIVGPLLAQNTIPLKIKKNQLIILTKHAVFSQELSFMDQMIIQKIIELYPSYQNSIKKISFINGNYSSEEFQKLEKKTAEKESSQAKNNFHPFDPKYRQLRSNAEKVFSDIEDPELKEMLINLFLIY